jgi:energy-coupling factor transport system substrate-specific component
MIAVVAVLTFAVQVPIPATGGYVHLGDAGVFFSALAFGPWIGGVAGGVGCAIADILSGYATWAPLTLLAHGLQGVVAGILGHRKGIPGLIVGWVLGGAALVAIYFLGEWFFYGLGLAGAAAEIVPNLIQVGVGGIVGIPLLLAVRKAYPPIERIGQSQTWTEE